MSPDDAVLRERYERERYVAVPGLLAAEVVDLLVAYANILGSTERFGPDGSVGRSLSRYGAPGFDALLISLGARLSAIAGAELVPTYSYARVYFEGDELLRHRDRPACEHSATIHLDASGGSWPLELERIDGEVASIQLEPGDAVLYRGIELPHWRGPCPDEWYLQLFLHWVAADGPHASQALDRRGSLGVEPVATGRRQAS